MCQNQACCNTLPSTDPGICRWRSLSPLVPIHQFSHPRLVHRAVPHSNEKVHPSLQLAIAPIVIGSAMSWSCSRFVHDALTFSGSPSICAIATILSESLTARYWLRCAPLCQVTTIHCLAVPSLSPGVGLLYPLLNCLVTSPIPMCIIQHKVLHRKPSFSRPNLALVLTEIPLPTCLQ